MWTDPRNETAATTVAPTDARVGDSIDPEVVAALLELGDADFFADLVDDFVNSTRAYLDSLDAALVAGDAETVYETAHTMKSSAASIGALRFSGMCRDIEACGRAGELGDLGDVAASLEDEFARVCASLATAVSGLG